MISPSNQVQRTLDALIGLLEEAPIALTWTARRGEHRLQVLLRDRAGNEIETEIGFKVE